MNNIVDVWVYIYISITPIDLANPIAVLADIVDKYRSRSTDLQCNKTTRYSERISITIAPKYHVVRHIRLLRQLINITSLLQSHLRPTLNAQTKCLLS